MRGISIFQKPHYREFRTMRGRPMRGLPVQSNYCTYLFNIYITYPLCPETKAKIEK